MVGEGRKAIHPDNYALKRLLPKSYDHNKQPNNLQTRKIDQFDPKLSNLGTFLS